MKTSILMLVSVISFSAMAAHHKAKDVNGVCFIERDCQGEAAEKAMPYRSCAFYAFGKARVASWTETNAFDAGQCLKPTIDVLTEWSRGVRAINRYMEKYQPMWYSHSYKCDAQALARGCRDDWSIVGGDSCSCGQ